MLLYNDFYLRDERFLLFLCLRFPPLSFGNFLVKTRFLRRSGYWLGPEEVPVLFRLCHHPVVSG